VAGNPIGVLIPQDEDTAVLQNIGNYLPNNTAAHAGRFESSPPVTLQFHVPSSSWEHAHVW